MMSVEADIDTKLNLAIMVSVEADIDTKLNLETMVSVEADIDTKLNELPTKVEEAYERIKNYALKTPLMFSKDLSTLSNAEVFLKLESEQTTGSCKLRGAFNKMILLKNREPDALQRGIIAASSGNHGLACVHAASCLGCSVEIFGKEGMSQAKVDTLKQVYGANVTQYGRDALDAELLARKMAQDRNQSYISPYNDWDIMAGQGTVGYEIYAELPTVDYVLVSVGGGGIIGGTAVYLKYKNPNIKVVGCQAVNSKVMYESILSGQLTHESSKPTLSDGTSGDIEDGSITFPACKKYVDDWILVDEKQISDAVFFMLDKHHKLVEGAAGVALAAFFKQKKQFEGKKVAILICGGNIISASLKTILDSNLS